MAADPRSRRAFLRTLSLSALGLAGLWRFLTPTRLPEPRGISLRVEEVPVGGALVLPDAGVAVTRTAADEVDALGLRCTHLGCRVAANEDGFACPCHGSRFDTRGAVLRGPAERPLERLPYTRRDGVVRVTV